MSKDANQVPKTGRPFLQHLPRWIYADPAYATLSVPERHLLSVIAGKCDQHRTGLAPAFTGRKLFIAAGLSRSSFWRHLGRLEGLGYVVVVSRGGGKLASVLAIPGWRGAFDELRVERRTSANGRGGAEPQKFDAKAFLVRLDSLPTEPVVSQPQLVSHDTPALVSQRDTAPVSDSDGTRLSVTRHPSQCDTAAVSSRDTTISIYHPPCTIPLEPSPLNHHLSLSDEDPGLNFMWSFCAFWQFWPRHHRKTERGKVLKFWRDHQLEALGPEIN